MLILLALFLQGQSAINENNRFLIKDNNTNLQIDKKATILNAYGKSGNENEFQINRIGDALISGRGEISHNFLKSSKFYLYRHHIKRIKIGDEITSIGEFSFSNFDQLEEIIFGRSVQNIYSFAFHNCYNIKKIIYTGNESPKCSIDSFSQTKNIKNSFLLKSHNKHQTNEMKLCSKIIQIEPKSMINDNSKSKYSNPFKSFTQNKDDYLTYHNNFNENESDKSKINESFNIYQTKSKIHTNPTTKEIFTGNCGVNAFYFIDTTTKIAIINGTGPMNNWAHDSSPLYIV